MTTIATDGKSMAGDGLTHWDGVITAERHQKVYRLGDGRLAGFCGPTSEYRRFAAWLEACTDAPPDRKFERCSALVIDGKSIMVFDEDGLSTRYLGHMAIGSGMPFALVAMDLGQSPEAAVKAASKRDIHTGGKITVLHLGDDER